MVLYVQHITSTHIFSLENRRCCHTWQSNKINCNVINWHGSCSATEPGRFRTQTELVTTCTGLFLSLSLSLVLWISHTHTHSVCLLTSLSPSLSQSLNLSLSLNPSLLLSLSCLSLAVVISLPFRPFLSITRLCGLLSRTLNATHCGTSWRHYSVNLFRGNLRVVAPTMSFCRL